MNNHRKTLRAEWIPYNEGEYFVTICCKHMKHFFGEISNGVMHLSLAGKIVDRELSSPQIHHPHIEIPVYVVMPNHLHAIVCINECRSDIGKLPECGEERNLAGYIEAAIGIPASGRNNTLLGAYVGSMKSAVTREVRPIMPEFAWLPRYHDHKIRNNDELNRISQYIENNVALWGIDEFNL